MNKRQFKKKMKKLYYYPVSYSASRKQLREAHEIRIKFVRKVQGKYWGFWRGDYPTRIRYRQLDK